MEIRKAYLRRSIKRARLEKRVAVAAMLAITGCAALLLQQQAQRLGQGIVTAATPATPAPAQAVPRLAADASPAAARRVYPYSIVPGGVTDRVELARAVMADAVVAAHYAGFAVDKASLRKVEKARAVYVSYRKGDKVYWTARKVMLAEGEDVLSDGLNEIRARCGNRISDTPQLPVEAKGPDEHELDTPVEFAQDGGDGAVRTVAFGIDEADGGGQGFTLASIQHGAGLLAAAQPRTSPAQPSLDSLFDNDRKVTSYASLWSPASDAGQRTTGSESPGGESTTGGSSGSTSDTATGGSGGTPDTTVSRGTTDGGSTDSGSGDKPTDGDSGKQPAPTPPPGLRTDLPSGTIPAKPHELPEPDGLWLSGVAFAALLLQRRLRRSR